MHTMSQAQSSNHRKFIRYRAVFTLILGLLAPFAAWALDPTYAPGGHFDLKYWDLQLPVGSGGKPAIIPSSQLQGRNGYQDPGHHYFFTESGDGAMVMKVPGSPSSSGCVTTSHSPHCRSELREVDPSNGRPISWNPQTGTNRLTATVAVPQPDDGKHGTVIGQIHIDESVSVKPLCLLYYDKNGDIVVGVEQTRSGNDEVFTKLGNVPVGQQFSYEIDYDSNQLRVGINGHFKTLSTFSLDAPLSYFKAGNYNQGNSPSEVHFFALAIQH
jgi:hypothetical protein